MKEKPIVFQSKKDLNKRINLHVEPMLKQLREQTIKDTASSLYYMNIMLLVDEFNFNEKQIEQYCKAYMSKIECLNGNWVTMQDFEDWAKENGINLEIG